MKKIQLSGTLHKMAAFGGTPQPSTSSQSTTTEHVVRVPNNCKKRYGMIKFSSGSDIDFLKQTTVKMERENNLKEYKSAYDIDTMPKFGAGSEYGRDLKEEARRKKHGINIKKYNPEDQPWLMKVGSGKTAKRFKGVREGTITENTSYYIFTQCADDAFEAFPIEEWYNFQPMIRYKYLNVDEAEEEFSRRDRIMNKWSIMARKRIKNETETDDLDEDEKKSKSKAKTKKDKSLQLTDMEDWAISSDENDDGDDEEDGEGSKPKEKKKDGKPVKRKKNAKLNNDDEAIEESDEGDFDDRELDYITDSEESESELDEKDKDEKYDDKGVDQEDGLKKLIDSEEESSEEEKNEEENEDEEEKEEEKTKKKDGEESDSSSSSSGSESDIEKEEKISSVLFMQKKKGSSRSNTPTMAEDPEKQALKRKLEPDEVAAKKARTDSPLTTSPSISSSEITEETIRRYLMRKPMTAKELVQKFKSKLPQMTKEQMTQKIGQLLKRINPDRKYVNNILYLSVKKKD